MPNFGAARTRKMIRQQAQQFRLFESLRECLYCGGPADTRDHVPPRLLLERPVPHALRTVNACGTCNRSWSRDEEYVRALTHKVGFGLLSAKQWTTGPTARGLDRRPSLRRLLDDGATYDDSGRLWQRPDLDRVNRVVLKISRGLWYLDQGAINGLATFTVLGTGHLLAGGLGLLQETPESSWPEVGSRKLGRWAASFTLLNSASESDWRIVQEQVFRYRFLLAPIGFTLQMVIYETVVTVVLCRPIGKRGRN
jgi:hypothetical protein